MRNGFHQSRVVRCAAGIVAGLLLHACAAGIGGGQGAPAPSLELAGTQWEIIRIDDRARIGAALTASFSVDGRVTGDSGCNSYAGPFIQTGETVRFGDLLSTRRACVDESRQQQESRVLAIMNGETTISRDGRELRLRGANGSLRLRPQP